MGEVMSFEGRGDDGDKPPSVAEAAKEPDLGGKSSYLRADQMPDEDLNPGEPPTDTDESIDEAIRRHPSNIPFAKIELVRDDTTDQT